MFAIASPATGTEPWKTGPRGYAEGHRLSKKTPGKKHLHETGGCLVGCNVSAVRTKQRVRRPADPGAILVNQMYLRTVAPTVTAGHASPRKGRSVSRLPFTNCHRLEGRQARK
jgi:hypothetical protein